MTKYVLSIDGGGVRGLASATFLSELDKSTNKKLSESFDLIVGTSTGGIIALAISILGLENGINPGDQLNVEIRYSVSYGLLGMVQLDCEVMYSDKKNNVIKSAQSQWEKEHKLPEKMTGELYNRVLGEGSFEVLNIARKLGLPPPFKIEDPQVKMGGNKKIKPKTNSIKR